MLNLGGLATVLDALSFSHTISMQIYLDQEQEIHTVDGGKFGSFSKSLIISMKFENMLCIYRFNHENRNQSTHDSDCSW